MEFPVIFIRISPAERYAPKLTISSSTLELMTLSSISPSVVYGALAGSAPRPASLPPLKSPNIMLSVTVIVVFPKVPKLPILEPSDMD